MARNPVRSRGGDLAGHDLVQRADDRQRLGGVPDHGGEGFVDLLAARDRARAGGADLDQERARERGLGGERLEVGADGVLGRPHRRHQHLGAGVVGGQEARLLVGEMLVEGLARDAGVLDYIGDGGGAVAVLGHHLGHGVEQPAALRGEHLLAGEAMGAARERSGAGHGVRNTTVSTRWPARVLRSCP
jgi:hypothetical protein